MAATSMRLHVNSGASIGGFACSQSRTWASKSVFFNAGWASDGFRKASIRSRKAAACPVMVVADKAAGMDLGAMYSAVAAEVGVKPTAAANIEGEWMNPSVVAQMMMPQAVANPPDDGVSSGKRFIWRNMLKVDEEPNEVSCRIPWGENGGFKLNFPAVGMQFPVEEVFEQVLRKRAVDNASKFSNDGVVNSMATVPEYFNDSQRAATKVSGHTTGLDVLRIINGSVAFGFEKKSNDIILIFALGVSLSLFDVSDLEVYVGSFVVLSTSRVTQLDGNDFDKRIMDGFALNFKRDEGFDLLKDKKALQQLIETTKKAKMESSYFTQSNIMLPLITGNLDDSQNILLTLPRANFEDLCYVLLGRNRFSMDNALRNENSLRDTMQTFSYMNGVNLDCVSTCTPFVHDLADTMIGLDPNVTVYMKVIAFGVSVKSGVLSGYGSDICYLDSSSQYQSYGTRQEGMGSVRDGLLLCNLHVYLFRPTRHANSMGSNHFLSGSTTVNITKMKRNITFPGAGNLYIDELRLIGDKGTSRRGREGGGDESEGGL